MRKITHIVVHCTATPQSAKVSSIQKYWREKLKWKSPGYHKLIEADGTIHTLANDDQVCNGVKGFNHCSLHVSYIGGVGIKKPEDNRTNAQKLSLIAVLNGWLVRYPEAEILGHRDFPGVAKACPSFDAKKEYEKL